MISQFVFNKVLVQKSQMSSYFLFASNLSTIIFSPVTLNFLPLKHKVTGENIIVERFDANRK
jgi:hypothetical protein